MAEPIRSLAVANARIAARKSAMAVSSPPQPLPVLDVVAVALPDPLVALAETIVGFMGATKNSAIYFRNPVLTRYGFEIQHLNWGTHKHGEHSHAFIEAGLRTKPFVLRNRFVVSTNSSRDDPLLSPVQLVEKLFAEIGKQRSCNECLDTYDEKDLQDGKCCGCYLAQALNPQSHQCSICQCDATAVYYTTPCGHHFHKGCIAGEFEKVDRERGMVDHDDSEEETPMRCPNCRGDMNSVFASMMYRE